jgi:uncharacterized membrane protein YqjE
MKALFVLLVLSTVAIVVAAIATRWRLHRHLRKSDEMLKETLEEMEAEQEPVEQ